MKTLVLLIALTLNLNSQVQIVHIEKNICLGDSMRVLFTWNNFPGTTNFTASWPMFGSVWSFADTSFYKLRKYVAGGDTFYSIAFATSKQWPSDTFKFGIDFETYEVVVLNCDMVGLTDLTPNKNENKTYFDINGNACGLETRKILINKKRKFVIQ